MKAIYQTLSAPAKLLLLLALSGCGSDSSTGSPGALPEANGCRSQNSIENIGNENASTGFRALTCPALADYSSDLRERREEVIDNHHKYVELYTMADPDSQADIPEVDFNEEFVVFLHMGEQSSSNHLIQITNVAESEDAITITYETIWPCNNCEVDGALTYPYCFVAIEKTDKTILFDELAVNECWQEE